MRALRQACDSLRVCVTCLKYYLIVEAYPASMEYVLLYVLLYAEF
jgi:hypothetical protein